MAIANQLVRELIAEFWGTFFLCLTVVSCAGAGGLVPIAAGLVLMTQVYSYGYISGGQFNPAVTLAVTIVKLVRKVEGAPVRLVGFIAVQLAAGFLAGALGGSWKGSKDPNALTGFVTSEQRGTAWTCELFYTFLLVSSVLNCAVASQYKDAGNQFYGLVIGMSVSAGALAIGNYSGGAFNPAVALALDSAQAMHWTKDTTPFGYYYIYLTADLLGGALAAGSFLAISPNDEQVDEARREKNEKDGLMTEKYSA